MSGFKYDRLNDEPKKKKESFLGKLFGKKKEKTPLKKENIAYSVESDAIECNYMYTNNNNNNNDDSNDSPKKSLLQQVKDVDTGMDKAKDGASALRKGAAAAHSAVSAAGNVVTSLANVVPTPVTIGMQVLESARNGINACTTYAHIGRLNQIKEVTQDPRVEALNDYVIQQKNTKLLRSACAAMPVVSIVNTIVVKGQALKKIAQKTRGVERGEIAEEIWEFQRSGDDDAQAMCAELLGRDRYDQIRDTQDGHNELAEKLKST